MILPAVLILPILAAFPSSATAVTPSVSVSQPQVPDGDNLVEKAHASEERLHGLALSTMPEKGWQQVRSKRALLIASRECGKLKSAKRRADGVLDWLDDTFEVLRPIPYTRAPVIRIFESPETLGEYKLPDDGELSALQVLTCLDPAIPVAFDLSLQMGLLDFWFDDHRPGLMVDLPYDLSFGLRLWIGQMDASKKKVSPPSVDLFIDSARTSAAVGRAIDLREILLRAESRDFTADPANPVFPGAAGMLLVDYFLSPKSKAKPGDREELQRFMLAIIEARAGLEARLESSDKVSDERPIADRLLEKRKQIIATAFEATFGTWSVKRWAKFEAGFRKAYRLR